MFLRGGTCSPFALFALLLGGNRCREFGGVSSDFFFFLCSQKIFWTDNFAEFVGFGSGFEKGEDALPTPLAADVEIVDVSVLEEDVDA
jgi:hypothetical protein